MGYKYAHDYPGHWVEQECMSEPKKFYEPTDLGDEKRIKAGLPRGKGSRIGASRRREIISEYVALFAT